MGPERPTNPKMLLILLSKQRSVCAALIMGVGEVTEAVSNFLTLWSLPRLCHRYLESSLANSNHEVELRYHLFPLSPQC